MSLLTKYEGAKTCTGVAQTGARGAMAWFLAAYATHGALNSGIYNCRSVRGGSTTSLHGEGRAADFGLKWLKDLPIYSVLAEQLRKNSQALGIQCVIFNRRIWSAGHTGWRAYTGVSPHTDHLHVEFSWTAARRGFDETVALWEKTLRGGVEVQPTGGTDPVSEPVTVKANSGNSKADNVAIAELLNSLGYNAGRPDGVPGVYLQAGVRSFQLTANKHGGARFNGDGDWGPLTQKWFEWVRDELQRNVGLWQASQDLGKLRRDGDYAKLTNQHVAALQRRNPKRYKGKVDGKAQAMTCKAFDIKPFNW